MANNRKCIVCGTEYSYCPSCTQDRKKPKWMSRFDKEDCKDIFEIGCAFEQKKISALEANKQLDGKKIPENIVSPSLATTLAAIKTDKVFKEVDKTDKSEKVEKIVKKEEKNIEEAVESGKKTDTKTINKEKKFFVK